MSATIQIIAIIWNCIFFSLFNEHFILWKQRILLISSNKSLYGSIIIHLLFLSMICGWGVKSNSNGGLDSKSKVWGCHFKCYKSLSQAKIKNTGDVNKKSKFHIRDLWLATYNCLLYPWRTKENPSCHSKCWKFSYSNKWYKVE